MFVTVSRLSRIHKHCWMPSARPRPSLSWTSLSAWTEFVRPLPLLPSLDRSNLHVLVPEAPSPPLSCALFQPSHTSTTHLAGHLGDCDGDGLRGSAYLLRWQTNIKNISPRWRRILPCCAATCHTGWVVLVESICRMSLGLHPLRHQQLICRYEGRDSLDTVIDDWRAVTFVLI